MNYNELGKAFNRFLDYLETYDGKKDLTKFLNLISAYSKNVLPETQSTYDSKIANLIRMLEYEKDNAVILILKNKNSFFDMFIFKREVSFAPINVATSEALLETIRKNPIDGYVIENISDEDILIFLKAYYVYRKSPEVSKTAMNLVNEYNYECLEMASFKEKFSRNDLSTPISLKSIILYDDEALPYHLDYLNDYHKEIENRRTSSSYGTDFRYIMKEVREDRFIGMSLQKYKG